MLGQAEAGRLYGSCHNSLLAHLRAMRSEVFMAKHARTPQKGARTSGADMVPGEAAFKLGHDSRAENTNR